MARFKGGVTLEPGVAAPREHQGTFFERLEGLTRRVEGGDPVRAAVAVFSIVLVLMAVGLLVQASHAATTIYASHNPGYAQEVVGQAGYRILGLVVLLLAFRIGPRGLRAFLPLLVVLSTVSLILVFVPGFGAIRNGAHRWISIPGLGFSFQPSELARIVMVLWVADRCIRLGPKVRHIRSGVVPMLLTGLFVFGLILVETDVGGAMLFLICFLCTMWVGGARPVHVASSLLVIGGGALLVAVSSVPYVRGRVDMWLGQASNSQVSDTLSAMASGDLWGVGLGQGLFRNDGVPYLDSDYAFALVGEELGFVGCAILLGLLLAFTWYSLKLVLSVRDPYCALAAFGLLTSVALQAMLHVQVVTGLAPPKGMTLPFISDGGTSLVVSSLAVGLALGAARHSALQHQRAP